MSCLKRGRGRRPILPRAPPDTQPAVRTRDRHSPNSTVHGGLLQGLRLPGTLPGDNSHSQPKPAQGWKGQNLLSALNAAEAANRLLFQTSPGPSQGSEPKVGQAGSPEIPPLHPEPPVRPTTGRNSAALNVAEVLPRWMSSPGLAPRGFIAKKEDMMRGQKPPVAAPLNTVTFYCRATQNGTPGGQDARHAPVNDRFGTQ